MREGFAAHPRSQVMLAVEDERRGVRHGEIHVVHACELWLRARHICAAHRGREWMTGHSGQCFAKGSVGVRATTAAEMDRADGIPGIRRTFTRIQLTVAFELELARKFLERTLLVPTRRLYE